MIAAQKLFTIRVPTKAYLKKYITARYGHPIRISNATLIGVMIFSMAQKNITTNLNTNKKDLKFKFFNDLLLFRAPISEVRTIGLGLTSDAVIQLNRFFEAHFEDDLYTWCQAHIKSSGRRKGYDKAIYSFADKYFIDLYSDITFDALKQTEFRYRKAIETNYKNFCLAQQQPQQLSFI